MNKSIFTLTQDPRIANLRSSIDRAIEYAKSNGVDDEKIELTLKRIINYRRLIRGAFHD